MSSPYNTTPKSSRLEKSGTSSISDKSVTSKFNTVTSATAKSDAMVQNDDFSPFLHYDDDSNFNIEDLDEVSIEPITCNELLYECSFCTAHKYCSTHSKEREVYKLSDRLPDARQSKLILETLQENHQSYVESNYKKWLVNLTVK